MAEAIDIGMLPDGRTVRAVDLAADGLEVRVLDHGARLAAFRRVGGQSVAVAPESLAGYQGPARYAGPVIGPVINRLGGAVADVGSRICRFEANEAGRHSLHSGSAGTHDMTWRIRRATRREVSLAVDLSDGHGGFPGNRRISVRYAIENGGLVLDIEAETDALTLMNPGLHGVWTIGGRRPPGEMQLTIPGGRYLPVDAETIPTGEIAPVDGTPYDHRTARAPSPSLDHNYCFDGGFGLRARLEGPGTECLEVFSDAVGLQAYAGGMIGVALEPQRWPDAPHHPHFPSIALSPGVSFRQQSRFVIANRRTA